MSALSQSRPSLAATILTLLLGVLASTASFCQAVSEDQVKAAYIYSFAKFVEWPAQTFPGSSSPFRFCVFNNPAFQAELERTVKGKSVAGHTIEVVTVHDAGQARNCHLLVIDSSKQRQFLQVMEALRGANILIVGEAPNFIDRGGTIGFLLEDEHVYFEINQKAATLAGLYVSSRLLGVAKRVIQ